IIYLIGFTQKRVKTKIFCITIPGEVYINIYFKREIEEKEMSFTTQRITNLATQKNRISSRLFIIHLVSTI
ncbi:MAG: hypothetical protein ACJ702_08300, partial [Nitrososphaeraceae archaeon]